MTAAAERNVAPGMMREGNIVPAIGCDRRRNRKQFEDSERNHMVVLGSPVPIRRRFWIGRHTEISFGARGQYDAGVARQAGWSASMNRSRPNLGMTLVSN